jgi:hypothetical protein
MKADSNVNTLKNLSIEEKNVWLERILRVNNLERGDDMVSPVVVNTDEQPIRAVSMLVRTHEDVTDADFVLHRNNKYFHFHSYGNINFPELSIGDCTTEIDPITFFPKTFIVDKEWIKTRSAFTMRFALSDCKTLKK